MHGRVVPLGFASELAHIFELKGAIAEVMMMM